MKKKKILSLVDIAANSINVPDIIKINTMEVNKFVYLQDDTLIPVFIYFANVLSQNIYGSPIINISLKKVSNALCFAIIDEKEDSIEDYSNSDTVKILLIMDSMSRILGIEYNQTPNLTTLIDNWRTCLADVKEGEEIKIGDQVEELIINHLPYFKAKNENKPT